MFAKFDEILSLPVQDTSIKEKPKCHRLRITKANNNVHLVDINVLAKLFEIPSLPFQVIEKPKRRGRTDGWTDRQTT